MKQTAESLHRTYVGKESELLAHGQQSLLGAHLGRWIVVVLGVAHCCEEHRVGLLTSLEGLGWERVAAYIDGMGTCYGLGVLHFVAELGCNGIHDSHSLGHYLRSDTVAGDYCNFQFHIFSVCWYCAIIYK